MENRFKKQFLDTDKKLIISLFSKFFLNENAKYEYEFVKQVIGKRMKHMILKQLKQ